MAWFEVFNSITQVLKLLFLILIIKEIINLIGVISNGVISKKEKENKRKEEQRKQQKIFEDNKVLGEAISNESQRINRLNQNSSNLKNIEEHPNFPDGIGGIKDTLVSLVYNDASELEKEYKDMIKTNKDLLKKQADLISKEKKNLEETISNIKSDENTIADTSKAEEKEAKATGVSNTTKNADLKLAEEKKIEIMKDRETQKVTVQRITQLINHLKLIQNDEIKLNIIEEKAIPIAKEVTKLAKGIKNHFNDLNRTIDVAKKGILVGQIRSKTIEMIKKIQELIPLHNEIKAIYERVSNSQAVLTQEFDF